MSAGKKLLCGILTPLIILLGVAAPGAPIPLGIRSTRLNRPVAHCRQPGMAYDSAGDALLAVEKTRVTHQSVARTRPLGSAAMPASAAGTRPKIDPRLIAAYIRRRRLRSRGLAHCARAADPAAILAA